MKKMVLAAFAAQAALSKSAADIAGHAYQKAKHNRGLHCITFFRKYLSEAKTYGK